MLYLDLALEAAGRTAVEARLGDVRVWARARTAGSMSALLRLLAACLENACLGLGSNQALALCYQDLWVRTTRLAWQPALRKWSRNCI